MIHPSISSLVVGSALISLVFQVGIVSKKHREFCSKAGSITFLMCAGLVLASFVSGFFSGVEGEVIKDHYFYARITLFFVAVTSLIVGLRFVGVSGIRYELLTLIFILGSFVLIVLSGREGSKLSKIRLEQKLSQSSFE